jgi:flagellar hook-length control protein FliK
MATIASNVFLGAGGTAKSESAPKSSGNDFMHLVQGMIQGNTAGEQLPSNLLQLLLTGDAAGLEGALDDDSADGIDGDEAAAAAASGLAAMLAGLQQVPVAGAAGGDSTGGSSIGAVGSQRGDALQALLAASQGALAGALGGAAGDGIGATGVGADGSAGGLGVAGGAGSAAGAGAARAGFGIDALLNATADPNAATPNGNATGAAHLQNTLLAHRAADMAPQAASAEVRTPVGAQGWSDEIGTHLTMMAANGREAASLRLSPEHLGPLEVQISMKDGQANVVFGASNADTRSALEQSLPRLREMFAAQGLTLGNANVSRDAPRDSHRPTPQSQGSRGSSDASTDMSVKRVTLSRVGLVDTYV